MEKEKEQYLLGELAVRQKAVDDILGEINGTDDERRKIELREELVRAQEEYHDWLVNFRT